MTDFEFAPVKRSPLDETRFGIRTARAMDISIQSLPQVLEFCRAEKIRLLIARCSSKQLPVAQAMEALGFSLMDTLVYFQHPLENIPVCHKIPIRSAGADDREQICAIARTAFRGYDGHYHADPRLDRTACDELYVDWAGRSCSQKELADEVLIAEPDGNPVGFLTLKKTGNTEADGRLYAVAPQAQGRGIGQALLVAGLNWCRERGLRRMIISTQITNLASQVSWVRVGFTPSESFYTFHKWFDEEQV